MTIDAMPPAPIKVPITRAFEDLNARVSSPRPETPEPDSRQGRRNARAAGVQLLDDDGAISAQVSVFIAFYMPSEKLLLILIMRTSFLLPAHRKSGFSGEFSVSWTPLYPCACERMYERWF